MAKLTCIFSRMYADGVGLIVLSTEKREYRIEHRGYRIENIEFLGSGFGSGFRC